MRSHGRFFISLTAALAIVVVVSVFPAVATDGDPVIIGAKNTGKTVTRLNTRGGLRVDSFKVGNPALILNVADPTGAPMVVNGTGLVDNLNADLLDGVDSTGFAPSSHGHADLDGSPASSYYGGGFVADAAGLPLMGATCLLEGGYLLAIARDGSPYCSPALGTGTFTNSGQTLGTSDSYEVAVGDLAGDGDLDAFIANYRANRVWANG